MAKGLNYPLTGDKTGLSRFSDSNGSNFLLPPPFYSFTENKEGPTRSCFHSQNSCVRISSCSKWTLKAWRSSVQVFMAAPGSSIFPHACRDSQQQWWRCTSSSTLQLERFEIFISLNCWSAVATNLLMYRTWVSYSQSFFSSNECSSDACLVTEKVTSVQSTLENPHTQVNSFNNNYSHRFHMYFISSWHGASQCRRKCSLTQSYHQVPFSYKMSFTTISRI